MLNSEKASNMIDNEIPVDLETRLVNYPKYQLIAEISYNHYNPFLISEQEKRFQSALEQQHQAAQSKIILTGRDQPTAKPAPKMPPYHLVKGPLQFAPGAQNYPTPHECALLLTVIMSVQCAFIEHLGDFDQDSPSQTRDALLSVVADRALHNALESEQFKPYWHIKPSINVLIQSQVTEMQVPVPPVEGKEQDKPETVSQSVLVIAFSFSCEKTLIGAHQFSNVNGFNVQTPTILRRALFKLKDGTEHLFLPIYQLDEGLLRAGLVHKESLN